MKKQETVFKEKALKALRKIPLSWFEKIQQVALRGTPDIIGCVNGRFVAIELKTEEGSTSKLQDLKLEKVLKAKGLAFVLTPKDLPKLVEILKTYTEGTYGNEVKIYSFQRLKRPSKSRK